MKKLILLASISFFIASCDKKNENLTCPDWYTGTDCKTEVRAQYFGTYGGTAIMDGQTGQKNTTISAGGAISELLADNDLKLTLGNSNNGSFTIPYMTKIGDYYTRSGSGGSFSGNKLTMQITLDDGKGLNTNGEIHTLTFSGTK